MNAFLLYEFGLELSRVPLLLCKRMSVLCISLSTLADR